MQKKPDPVEDALSLLNGDGRIAFRGLEALPTARAVLASVVADSAFTIIVDASCPPDLVDYLGVGALGAAEGALAGAGVGLVLGILFGAPNQGLAVGAGLGAFAGLARAAEGVSDAGLRLRVGWLDDRDLILEVE